MQKVNLREKLAQFCDQWKPKNAGVALQAPTGRASAWTSISRQGVPAIDEEDKVRINSAGSAGVCAGFCATSL